MNKKNIILIIGIVVVIIIAAYLIFTYFGGKSEGDVSQTPSAAHGSSEDDGIFAKATPSSDPSLDTVSVGLNLSDSTLTGKGIYDLMAVLERLDFGIEFFENEKFTKLIDFSKKVEVRDEEKGNFNPFRPVGAVFIPSGAKTASSTVQ